MFTINHIQRMYDHECECCRHLKRGRTLCPVLQALRDDPNCQRLQGIIKDRGAGLAHCPYWEVKATA